MEYGIWISKNACQTDTIVKDGHYVYKVVSFLFVYNLISDKDGYYISQLISRRLIGILASFIMGNK